jgi:hypothetical protein
VKQIFTAAVSAWFIFAVGCATEGPTAEELQEQVRRGVSGEGRVTPEIDRTNDPYVKPREAPFPPDD